VVAPPSELPSVAYYGCAGLDIRAGMPILVLAICFAVALSLVYPDPLEVEHASTGIVMVRIRHQLKVLETDRILGGIPDRLVCSILAFPYGQVHPLSVLPFQEFSPDEPALLRQKPVLKSL
jgi:hypothetical protein